MKRGWKVTNSLFAVLLSVVLSFSLVGCGGGGGGGGTTSIASCSDGIKNQDETGIDTGGVCGTPAPKTTTISGKVSLSSTISGKPKFVSKAMKASGNGIVAGKAMKAGKAGKAGKAMKSSDNPMAGSLMQRVLEAASVTTAAELGSATVELYDADHAEWFYPVAITFTDSLGNYKFEKLCNILDTAGTDSQNATFGATYKCGDAIPVGKYTIIASKSGAGSTGGQVVAVQTVVKDFTGAITGNDLVAQDSDAVPSIVSMFGLSKNSDGSYGSTTTKLAANASIQVIFSMAMARESVKNAVTIVDSSGTAVIGVWHISADLLSATFDPASPLTPGTVYTVTVAGGKATKAAKNVYGIAIASEIKGNFLADSDDPTPPTAIRESPTAAEKTNMPITTPLRIASDEALDVNSIAVTSSPSIGAKPFIQYIGKVGSSASYPYVYEIVPADPLTINTTYTIDATGGTDLAGNKMDALQFSFTTEATSSGITTTGTTTEISAQVAVKDVFGKWVRALNDRSTTQLATFMSGDFFWISDPTKGPDDADINRDGRLSLNEFLGFFDVWFKQLDMCGATVTGDVTSITLNTASTSALLKFSLTITASNSSLSACSNISPPSDMYAVLQKINGGWIMTNGSDTAITDATAIPAKLTLITSTAPANGSSYPEPAATQPLFPEFKWTAASWKDSSGNPQPFATYAVVVIDNMSRFGEGGWVGLVNGSSATAGKTELSAKFAPKSGWSGTSLYILDSTNSGNFGFKNTITEFKSGGSYTWAVLGFKTNSIANFEKGMITDPIKDLGGSSEAASFSVAGTLKEYKVVVKDSKTGLEYSYNDMMDGYDAGSAGSVTIVVTAPVGTNTTGKKAYVDVYGYTYPGALSGDFVNGVATVSNIPLSNKWNWVTIGDAAMSSGQWMHVDYGMTSFIKGFGIVTKGGAMPKIKIGTVAGKKCDGASAVLTGPDSWGNYTSAEVCTVDISGTVDSTITGTLNILVHSESGEYRTQVAVSGGNYSLTGVSVFTGWNSVEVIDSNFDNRNSFNVDATVGSTYTPPIQVAQVGTSSTPTSSMLNESSWDAGSATTVTITGTMSNVSPSSCMPTMTTQCSGWSQMDANWNYVTNGPISSSSFSFQITLYNGWNNVSLSDAQNNWYNVKIFTTGSAVYTQPNTITSVDGTTVAPTMNMIQASDAGNDCIVKIIGTTTVKQGMINVSLNNAGSTSTPYVNEWQSVMPDSTGTYTIDQAIYAGTNTIDVNDGGWNWQGVSVTGGASCTAVAFGVTKVGTLDPVPGNYYDVGTATTVTITGTAKSGKSITATVSGMYYETKTTIAGTGNTFTIDLNIYNGSNYISLGDGANRLDLEVYTSGTATFISPFQITGVTAAAGDQGTVQAMDTTGYSYSGSALKITVSGTSTKDGTGWWYGGGSSGTFTVTGGKFSVDISLWGGPNMVDLFGPDGSWDGISFFQTGGTTALKQVSITSPTQNSVQAGPDIAVTGKVDMMAFLDVNYVWAVVTDLKTNNATFFSSRLSDQTGYSDKPITFDSATGSFSFTIPNIASGNPTEIYVEADNATQTVWHGDVIYVNNTGGMPGYSFKPKSRRR